MAINTLEKSPTLAVTPLDIATLEKEFSTTTAKDELDVIKDWFQSFYNQFGTEDTPVAVDAVRIEPRIDLCGTSASDKKPCGGCSVAAWVFLRSPFGVRVDQYYNDGTSPWPFSPEMTALLDAEAAKNGRENRVIERFYGHDPQTL